MRFFLTVLFLLVLNNTSSAIEFNVGVSPPIIDLEEVQPGEIILVKFFIVTRSDETLLVNLEPKNARVDFLNRDGYRELKSIYSEESVVEWVDFINNPVELDAATSDSRGRREINFLLNIPEDAEPGLHILTIAPIPTVTTGGGGVFSAVVAVVNVNVLFTVAGEAERKVEVMSIAPDEFAPNSKKVGITNKLKNTGTVSLTAFVTQKVFNAEGNKIDDLISQSYKLIPGQSRDFRTFIDAVIEPGEYNIETTINFATNSTTDNFSISLIPALEKEPITTEEEFPFTVIIILIIILAAAFYYYKS